MYVRAAGLQLFCSHRHNELRFVWQQVNNIAHECVYSIFGANYFVTFVRACVQVRVCVFVHTRTTRPDQRAYWPVLPNSFIKSFRKLLNDVIVLFHH